MRDEASCSHFPHVQKNKKKPQNPPKPKKPKVPVQTTPVPILVLQFFQSTVNWVQFPSSPCSGLVIKSK